MTRFRRTAFLVIVALAVNAAPALACPVCFGDPGSSEVQGAKWAIMFLLGVTGTVLSGVVSLLLYFRKRAKMALNGTVDTPGLN